MPGPVPYVPFIPDNAPFTAEQRAWLNGFLAGIYSHAGPTGAAEPLPALKIAVLYASQSGTAEGLARKLTKELTSKGHVPLSCRWRAIRPHPWPRSDMRC